MIQRCDFNKKRDQGLVIHGLNPDINDLIENHKISDSTADVVYNQLTEISQVGFRINDDFDAIVLSRALHASGLINSSGTGSSQPAGSTAPVVTSGND